MDNRSSSSDSFPRQYARTRRFTLGEPRSFRIAPDGSRIVFLRSRASDDAVNALHCVDVVAAGLRERVVADPRQLLAAGVESDLPAAERARRERAREQAEGITAYATDRGVTAAAFALGDRVYLADLLHGGARALAAQPGAFDPRVSPDGVCVAYVSDRGLRVVATAPSGGDRLLAGEADPAVSWGVADFIAAEELSRQRGYWWSPDSQTLAAARVDETPVATWYIGDPAHPERLPTVHRYPAAGTANANVTLHLIDVETAARVEVAWDHESSPYLVDVVWSDVGLHAVVMDRAQKCQQTLQINARTGATRIVHEVRDPVWVELTPGTPQWIRDGQLVATVETDDGPFGTRVLTIDGQTYTTAELQVRRVVDASDSRVVFLASSGTGTATAAYAVVPNGPERAPVPLSRTDAVVDVTAAASTAVLRVAALDLERPRFDVVAFDAMAGEVYPLGHVETFGAQPLVTPRVSISRLVDRGINVAVLLPSGFQGSTASLGARHGKLPVLLDPYGGPHAQRVVESSAAHASSQWLADQGFAVVVVDGRGTPGWGPCHERAVHLDLAGPVLDDQIAGLHAAAERHPELDLTKVAIRGWSFGGYLAVLAVLRRPDVFHAAVAGAPVTEWRLYDTGYTERYLGHPLTDPGPYDRTSLLAEAHRLERPLMLVHGLADDNVVAAHTLQLSSALLAAGRPHEVLPLSGVTHMTPQEVVAENLLLLQVAFLKRALGVAPVVA